MYQLLDDQHVNRKIKKRKTLKGTTLIAQFKKKTMI